MVITIKPNPFDKVIQAVVGTMLYSRLGDIAERTLINDLLHNPKLAADPESVESAKRLAKRQRRNRYDPAIRDSVENVRQQEHNRKMQKDLKGFFQDVETGREGSRPTTNNFRQARLGAALLAIESFGFALKLNPNKPWGAREYAEAAASLMMITSTAIDINYALCKSIREVEPYFGAKKGVEGRVSDAADIHRGALKAASGMLSSAAGVIAGALDLASFANELDRDKKDWLLMGVYLLRGTYSFAGAYAGFMATISYAGPSLAYLFANHPRLAASRVGIWLGSQGIKATGTAAAKAIANAKLARTLWLVRIARFNAIGLLLTAIELIYVLAIKDDPMENWCQACTFRQYKSKSLSLEAPFLDIGTELDELEIAFKAIVQ